MGSYINPYNETKEAFLDREGVLITKNTATWHVDFNNELLVALVDNGGFTAAAIAYDEGERNDFTSPDDLRPIKYYLVQRFKLYPVSNLKDYLPEKS